MDGFIIAITAVLAVIFLIILLNGIADRAVNSITTDAGSNPEAVECRIRELLKKNPDSEIIILDKSHSPEISEILLRMQRDFPEIHVKY